MPRRLFLNFVLMTTRSNFTRIIRQGISYHSSLVCAAWTLQLAWNHPFFQCNDVATPSSLTMSTLETNRLILLVLLTIRKYSRTVHEEKLMQLKFHHGRSLILTMADTIFSVIFAQNRPISLPNHILYQFWKTFMQKYVLLISFAKYYGWDQNIFFWKHNFCPFQWGIALYGTVNNNRDIVF